MEPFTSWVKYPGAPYTTKLVIDALNTIFPESQITTSVTFPSETARLLQWSTYDAVSHEHTLENSPESLASTYTIRKSLIRKHFLHESLHVYGTKHPEAYINSERGLGMYVDQF